LDWIVFGKCWRYCFRSSNALCCLGPHSTFVEPLNMLKKGRLLLASFPINLFRAAMWHVNFCTFFLFCGGCIWGLAFILSGLALMPLVEIRQPSTLPLVIPKTFLRVELELGFMHIGESLCQVGDVRCFFLTCHHYIINVR
jgi:hypothetical protein